MPLPKHRQRHRRRIAAALAAVTLLGCALGCGWVWRRSLRAAARAFVHPELLEPRLEAPPAPVRCELYDAPEGELDAHIAREFREVDALGLDDPDAAELAGLTTTDLPVAVTRRTLRFVRFFGTDPVGRKAFETRYRRAGRHRASVERQLREAGLPEDLVWLAAIESGFDPEAVSPAGAAGLWQFMPETGALYGLSLSPWLDERRSLLRSTEAAVTHLRDLFERLGSWDLALAAYNYGYDGVLRALQRYVEQQSSDRPPPRRALGFTDLAQAQLLPLETADYVPKVTAFAMVAANLARFDLDSIVPEDRLRLATLSVPEGTRLRTVARAAGLSTAELRSVNPALLQDRVPPTGGDYLLTVPADRLDHALAALPAYLDHEILLLEEGLGLPAQLGELVLGSPDDEAVEPPRAALNRPAHLGPNRLPAFPVPGRGEPSLGRSTASFASLDTALPEKFMGIRIGWHRPADPFSLLRRRSPNHANSTPVDPAIGKHLRFLSRGPGEPSRQLPYQETRLPSGMVVHTQYDPKAPRVAITVRVGRPAMQGAEGDTLALTGTEGELRYTEIVTPKNLDVGVSLAVGRLALLLDQTRHGPLAALRGQLNRRRRHALRQRPYGPSWLALSDALFPPDGPHAGTIVNPNPADGGLSAHRTLLASLHDERSAEQVTISMVGPVERHEALSRLSDALLVLGPELAGRHVADDGRERPIRVTVRDHVQTPRVLFGWPGPTHEAKASAPLQVAVYVLAGRKESRFQRELLTPGLAAAARGIVDGGWHTSAVALELTPAATVELATLERHTARIVDELGSDGPTRLELEYAKAILRYRLKKQIERATQPPTADSAEASLGGRIVQAMRPGFWQRSLAALEDVDARDVRRAVRAYLRTDRRVVVVTLPEADPSKVD